MSALQNVKRIQHEWTRLYCSTNGCEEFRKIAAEVERLYEEYVTALELLSPEERFSWNEFLKE